MNTATLKVTIVTTIARRGNGEETPIRIVREVYDANGEKLAEYDPLSYPIEWVLEALRKTTVLSKENLELFKKNLDRD